MNPIPPNFGSNDETNGFKITPEEPEVQSSSETAPGVLTSAEQARLQDAQQKLQRIFLVLVGIGVALGLIVAIALVLILNRFGLTDPPDSSESSQEPIHHIISYATRL